MLACGVVSTWTSVDGLGMGAVEVSSDAGATWREAQLGREMGRFAWREFRIPLGTGPVGPATVLVRARSRSGSVQPNAPTPNPSGYHHNAVQRLELEIT